MRKTIKNFEAELANVKAQRDRALEAEQKERTARYKAEQAQGNLTSEKLELERELNSLKRQVGDLEKSLIDASARIEVYEFLARLEHKVEKGSSGSGPLPERVTAHRPKTWNDVADEATEAIYVIRGAP